MDRAHPGELSPGRLFFAMVAAIVFIVDRLTKGLVGAYVTPGTEHQVLPFVWITNTHNSGAAFSLAPNATLLFTAASIAVFVALIWYVARTPVGAAAGATLGLILGGTAGNGYDRLFHGTVTDFIAVHFWPVFNVADAAVSVGVVLLVLGYLVRGRGA